MAVRDKDGGFSNPILAGDYNAEDPPLSEKYGEHPPQPYGAPTAQPQYYNAPTQYDSGPPQQYGAPPQQFGAPPQQYGEPPQQYGAPPQQYGVYTPPQAGYGGDKPPTYVSGQPQFGQTSSTTVVVGSPYEPSAIMVREADLAPTTGFSLAMAILSIFLCPGGWPFPIVSIIYNRKAHSNVQLGQYSTARTNLSTAFIFLTVSILLGIIGWIIFAVRLKAALDASNTTKDPYNYR